MARTVKVTDEFSEEVAAATDKLEAEETKHVSHYARYKEAHLKYQNSEKGKAARARYQSSDKAKEKRREYQKRRNAKIKELMAKEKEEASQS